MESIHQRKVKQKIACRMIKFTALSRSRSRTDSGHPLTKSLNRLSLQPGQRSIPLLAVRTYSNPDLYASSRNLNSSQEVSHDVLHELYTPYTSIGSYEDIDKLHEQTSVREMLSNLEQRSSHEFLQNTDFPITISSSKGNTESSIDDANKTKKPPVPKPKPKCATSSSVPESKSLKPSMKPRLKSLPDHTVDNVNKALLTFPPKSEKNNTQLYVSPKFQPYIFPKPAIRLKPVDTKEHKTKLNGEDVIKDGHSEPSGYKLSTSLSVDKSKILNSTSPDQHLSTRQQSVTPYEIADLSHLASKEKSKVGAYTVDVMATPVSDNNINDNKKKNRSLCLLCDNQNSYLEPTDTSNLCLTPVSPKSPISPNLESGSELCSLTDICSPTFKNPTSNKTKQKKRKRYKELSKSISISPSSIPMFSCEDDKRRQSLPDFLAAEYEEPDRTTQNYVSDDEGWNTDEFDSSDEDEEGFPTEQDIPKLPQLDTINKKLYNIVTEILTTERAYVKRLYLLDEVFQNRLREEVKENNIVPEKVLTDVFSNLSSIYKLHSSMLLPDLEKRVQEWSKINKIGDIFKTMGHCLVLYTVFVKNFDNAMSTLNHWLKKSLKFAVVVEELQKRPECENLSLQHHMLEPVQRVPRYKLLIQDYLKKLPAQSPDRAETEASLKIISQAAADVNNSMKENKKFKQLLEIQERIVDGLNGKSIVTASTVFIKEGELTKLAARNEKRKPRLLLLFNDFLLCCLITTIGKLRVRQTMDLTGLTIDDDDSNLPDDGFRIKSKQRILDLIAHDEVEKREWVTAIRSAVDDLHDKRGSFIRRALEEDTGKTVGEQAPLWIKDEQVTMCMLCTLKFGFIHRKHHCRGCGRVTCTKCSNYRAKLSYTNEDTKLRVCFSCYQKLGLDPGIIDDPLKTKKCARTRDATAGSDMSGEIFWKPPDKGWSKNWIVLSEFALYVQKKKQDVKAQCTLPVPGYTIESITADEIDAIHPFCLKIHKENKKEFTYFMSSDNKDIINQWKTHLEHARCLTKVPDDNDN